MNDEENLEALRKIDRMLGLSKIATDRAERLDENILDTILSKHGRKSTQIIAILQDIQASFGYLPREAIGRISRELEIPLTRLYAIGTFYKAFKLEPRGRHEICLCLGTACHVRGAVRVKDALSRLLHVDEGGTTEDGKFSFETVRCLGCCGQAPVMTVDGVLFGKVDHLGIERLLRSYK